MAKLNFLEKLATSSASNTSKYVENPALYGFKVKRLVYNEDAFNGAIFAAELEIIKASKTEAKKLKLDETKTKLIEDDKPFEPHAVGDNRSWVVRLTSESAAGNVFAFLCALTGKTEEAIKSAEGGVVGLFKVATSDKQPYAGTIIIADVFLKAQKADKTKSFTVYKWMHVPAAEATVDVEPVAAES